MFQLFPEGPRCAFLRTWTCGRSRNPEINRGWLGFLLDPLVKMLLSFFIHGGSPSNCIPHSSLSGITNMRRSLQKSIDSTCKLIKYSTSARTKSLEIKFQKSTSSVHYRKRRNENARERSLWQQLPPKRVS